jgi:hypothetical protein
MKDIGGLIWVIIVVIGVISSIVKNAKKAAAQREAARPRMAPAPQPAPAPQTLVQQMTMMPPVLAPAAPVSTPPVRRVQAPPAPQRTTHIPIENLTRAGTSSPIRGMFGSGASLVRAIIAAEVLGPPKSQQEHSIWSPRHSDPSI